MIVHSATRTIHRLACAIEDAGFEIRDTIAWLQWQGFPKSLDIGKAIEAGYHEKLGDEPVTAAAKRWGGWGTALKPAHEPATLARKPVSEASVAANVLRWGTGGVNVDACRYAPGDPGWPGPSHEFSLPEREVAAENNDWTFAAGMGRHRNACTGDRWPADIYYCPKPSTDERNNGLSQAEGNVHTTVKPVKLYRWLLRLVTPPGGTVLEPFGGSGTTLVAASREGFKVIAAEREPKYCDIIRARVTHALAAEG